MEGGELDRESFVNQTLETIDFQGSKEEFTNLFQDIFWANEPMVDVIDALAGRFSLFVLSNTSDLHIEHIRKDVPGL